MKQHIRLRFQFGWVLLLGLVCGIVAYPQAVKFLPPLFKAVDSMNINRGLDLQGGIHLEYKADTSQVSQGKENDALSAAEAVIERRVNAFGVGEPLVQLSRSGTEHRIIVELPGIKDIEEAKKMIKETPFLEFRELAGPDAQKQIDDLNKISKDQADKILIRAKNGENIEDLARQYSQDPGSKDKGGDLGFVKKAQLV